MKLLYAPTDQSIKTEITELAANASAGSNVQLTVANGSGFVAHDFVVVGTEGSEGAELCSVTAVTDTTITVSTLKFAHTSGEPVTKLLYDQRKFYGATTAGGSYTELTSYGSPAAIQVDDPQGTYLEYTGSEGYLYFTASYYNSYSSAESDQEAIDASESDRYASLYAIRKHAGFVRNPYYPDSRVETKRTQAENEINSAIAARYQLPLSEVPGVVSNVCETLAAGYIAYEEFGSDGDGGKMLGEARAIIKAIANGTQRLIGASFVELARNVKVGVLDGYPNDPDTDSAVFSMGDQY
jgi:phage gp36-like protein